jgi:hypothetical protein
MLPPRTPFDRWKALFVSDGNATEEELALIVQDPIIGWTASNVFRRVRLNALLQSQLRAFYRTLPIGSIRWRLVHTLGAQDALENIDILRDALTPDKPETLRYGAVRSLMEVAFRVPEQRALALQVLKDALPAIAAAPKALGELRRTAFVRNVDSSWVAAVLPLLEEAKMMVDTAKQRDDWEQKLAELRDAAGANREGTKAGS